MKNTNGTLWGWTLVALMATTSALGCGDAATPEATIEPEATRQHALDAVFVADSGHWRDILGCSGFCVSRYHFWVDVAVRNDAFHKEVGILWTDDGWSTIHTSLARYEATRGDGYETWGLDVEIGTGRARPSEIEYAVFARMNGQTFWDPRNNYYIYDKVSAESPVLRLSSEVHYEQGVGGVMTGRVRVFNVAFEKRVFVRYTTDDWATWQEVEGSHLGDQNDWGFRIEGLGESVGSLPGLVRYAVRYESGQGVWWDNNTGQDYQHVLAPTLTPGFTEGDTISGYATLYGAVRTDMPIAGTRARIDEGAWSDGLSVTTSTDGLSDGAHTLELEVTLEGGTTHRDAFTFQVANTLQPGDTWSPTLNGEPLGTAWELTRDAQGRVYVVWDAPGPDQIVRYPAFGDDRDPLVFEAIDWGLQHISVDAQGRVYAALTRDPLRIVRWTAEGALDDSFGDGGVVQHDGPLAGQPLCYAGATELGAGGLYLLDTCNERVLRFDREGGFIDAVEMSAPRIPSAIMATEGDLWVVQSGALTRLNDDPDAPLAIEEVIAFTDGAFNSARGLTRTADGVFWASDSVGALVAFDADGAILGRWTGGRDDRDAPGAFHLPQNVIAVDDETVAVLGAAGARIATFSLR